MTAQNVWVKLGDRSIRVQFAHCTNCAYFADCYPGGRGPNYIDESCTQGPVREVNK